ncbi:cytochrome P450 [Rhodofomes roseus]|uniref:Cytochrome P450 n=1 Tax=Rhodofomes roseus TaxID=34475 RepID=A0ABQ8KBV4_9APHY|nr:cytochrome P450 [Rhodofomes roseus]KAH9834639.1 cytochrome P450 [Rhodofomes roseus]
MPISTRRSLSGQGNTLYHTGDMVYARFLTRDVLIINSAEAARELMEQRGAKYSGRPLFTYICDLGGFSWNIGFITNDDRWKRHRRWFQHSFQTKDLLDGYVPIQQRETRRLLADLVREPSAFMDHLKRFSAAVMLEIGYGHTVTSIDDAHIRKVDSALAGLFAAGTPGSMLVDFFPILKYVPWWLPGAGWKRTAIRLRPDIDAMNLDPFRSVIKTMAAGSVKPSFAATLLEEAPIDEPISPTEEREMSGAAGVVYSAGTETTVSVLAVFVFAMVRHPAVFKKAQEEIDRIVGTGRLPQMDDREALPYLECVLKEVYRWGVPIPLSKLS